MKYFETFAGVGGFSLGIEYANFRKGGESGRMERVRDLPDTERDGSNEQYPTCIGFSEVDKYASAVLKYKFPNTKNYGDIKTIDWKSVPDFDLLVGGSPCQDLSVAGKRAGITGERSGLFAEFVRALQEKKPNYFIWENVKGALSSNQGWDFAEVQTQMAEAGYELWWQILNAKDFGVPQNRERIFVVGTRNGSPREILFERGTDEETSKTEKLSEPISNCLRTNYSNGHSNETYIRQLNQPKHSNDRVYSDEGISPTLNTMQGGNRQPFVAMRWTRTAKGREARKEAMAKGKDYTPFSGGHRTLTSAKDDTIGTITSQAIAKDSLLGNGDRIRRLTPLEAERLMSWPDDWTKYGIFPVGDHKKENRKPLQEWVKKEISDTQRYKMCGNGVVSEVVKEIVKNLL